MIAQWLGSDVPYEDGLKIQDEHVRKIQSGDASETLFLMEHSPVYTIGRTRDQSSLGEAPHLPHPVFEINRGGQATYHGPGQLVGYPILNLRNYGRDLHAYLRLLESVLVDTLSDFGIVAHTREGLTGAWVNERKIASIGVGVRKWITMHGFALNVSPLSLPPFLNITPCGIEGVTTTCLHHESSQLPEPKTVGVVIFKHLADQLANLRDESSS